MAHTDRQSTRDEAANEEQPLLQASKNGQTPTQVSKSFVGLIVLLMLGEVVVNADTTLTLAAAAEISSEWNSYRFASWLPTAYTLSVCGVQPLYGKLSDIFTRKPVLLAAYGLFGLGLMISGLAQSFPILIVGRVISGTGGAGIMTVGSIIITDNVPRRDTAKWRSYLNVAMTFGRSIGGPVGGWVLTVSHWRWLFLGRVPFVAVSMALVSWKMQSHIGDESGKQRTFREKLSRVDIIGSVLLISLISAIVIMLDQPQLIRNLDAASYLILSGTLALSTVYFLWTTRFTKEPIFDLRLLKRPTLTISYTIACLQTAAQVGMMYTVIPYFQVSMQKSTADAGARLVPAVIGNTFGALLAGHLIKQGQSVKLIIIMASIIGISSYTLQTTRWTGHTNFWETLYIMPTGAATGAIQSAVFVAMASAVSQEDTAMATSGLFLFSNLGAASGMTLASTVLRLTFRAYVVARLGDTPEVSRIVQKAMSDVAFITKSRGKLRQVLIQAYVSGLRGSFALSAVNTGYCLALAILIRIQEL